MSDTNFDVIIIGSGPGGYVTAIRSSQLGFKTAIVEKDSLGGVCLNWGCIPTKALLRSAEVYNNMKHAEEYGLSASPQYNLKSIVQRSRNIANQLSGGIKHLLSKNNVTIIDGFASLQPGEATPEVHVAWWHCQHHRTVRWCMTIPQVRPRGQHLLPPNGQPAIHKSRLRS